MWRRLGQRRRLPTFNTNLLIQSKRPTPLLRVSAILKRYGFRSIYWRFEITKHQQEILEKVSRKLRQKALIVYASPAFHTLDELYNYTEAQTIVENTNFVKVDRLHNHKQWNYYQPGTGGVAHSDPVPIEDEPFYSMIELMREYNREDDNAIENLRNLHEMVIEACNEIQEHNPISKYYLRLHNRLMRMNEIYEHEETIHYVAFNLFCNVTKLKWLVV